MTIATRSIGTAILQSGSGFSYSSSLEHGSLKDMESMNLIWNLFFIVVIISRAYIVPS